MTKREEVVAVLDYNDGSYYVGGLATIKVCRILGIRYGKDSPVKAAEEASRYEIKEIYNYLLPYIEHMRAHPKVRCESCGSIIND